MLGESFQGQAGGEGGGMGQGEDSGRGGTYLAGSEWQLVEMRNGYVSFQLDSRPSRRGRGTRPEPGWPMDGPDTVPPGNGPHPPHDQKH